MTDGRTLIVTLDLGGSFGGNLQAFALQKFLEDQGIIADTTSIEWKRPVRMFVRDVYYALRRLIHIAKPQISDIGPDLLSTINAKPISFVEKNIRMVDGGTIAKSPDSSPYSAIVVGSDQVWRNQYVDVEANLLNFAQDWDVTRISYAASFGVDHFNEFPESLRESTAKLAAKFDALSVREDSAVDLVARNWDGLEAEHHLDPTILLPLDDYRALIKADIQSTHAPAGNLASYVLDPHGEKREIITKVQHALNLEPFQVLPDVAPSRKALFADLDKYQLPSVAQWIRNISESEFVVTDSFHGTVFAIMFHRPFLAVGNASRGMARFTSLLATFGLEHRLIADASDISERLLNESIDWNHIDNVLETERARSSQYLLSHLGTNAN